ncbi:MAG: EF-hand domain-containing protein [Gemmataceae bacterium]|nr:EF-hand domain-containing protein [Gemmataceae bacterium]
MYATKTAVAHGLMLSAFLAFPFGGEAQAQTKSGGPRHDPLVDAKLRADFARVDSNKDGFLDAEELAKAFRGAKAVPPPALEYDDTGSVKPGTGLNKKFVDQTFLHALDKDFDGRISWLEFEEYGEAYAAAIRGQQLDQQRQQALYLQAQRNIAASQLRRSSYSRSNFNRNRYYRPVRRSAGYSARLGQRSQDQRYLMQVRMQQSQAYQRQVLQARQRQMQFLQQQQQRMLALQRAAYTRQTAPAYRPVKTPPRVRTRR